MLKLRLEELSVKVELFIGRYNENKNQCTLNFESDFKSITMDHLLLFE